MRSLKPKRRIAKLPAIINKSVHPQRRTSTQLNCLNDISVARTNSGSHKVTSTRSANPIRTRRDRSTNRIQTCQPIGVGAQCAQRSRTTETREKCNVPHQNRDGGFITTTCPSPTRFSMECLEHVVMNHRCTLNLSSRLKVAAKTNWCNSCYCTLTERDE